MIVIHVSTRVVPAKRAEFLREILRETPQSLAFTGCVAYAWSEDAHKPNHFSLYEEWKTAADFAAYKHSEHFKCMGEALFPLFAEHPESTYYEAVPLEVA